MDILLVVILILLNGLFAMSEMAVSVSRKARLAVFAEGGDRGAALALELKEDPNNFLSTVQVGITSIGVLNGIIGEAAFSAGLAAWLHSAGMGEVLAKWLATALVVTILTFVTIVFGELVPKRIGLLFPELLARWIALPMQGLARAMRPFVWLLSTSTQAVLKALRLNKIEAQAVTEEELNAQLSEGLDAGVIEAHEHKMVHNVFYLDDRQLGSLMLPRTGIAWLESVLSVEEALAAAGRSGHSYYPVCKDGLDHILGVVSVTDMLACQQPSASIESLMLPAIFVPETLSGMALLEQSRHRENRMVFVVDEYGVVQGLLTPYDLLEAITGELHATEPGDVWAKLEPDGSWTLDGLMPIGEVRSRLEIKEIPGEDKGHFSTLSGMLMSSAASLPSVGQRIEVADWEFEVLLLKGKRPGSVRARHIGQA